MKKTAITWGVFFVFLVVGLVFGIPPRKARCKRIDHDYIGAHRCKSCHESTYEKWEKSAHAKAFAILPVHEQKNSLCLSCHTTSVESHLQGVQCETCHGGGKHYIQKEIKMDPKLARSAGLKTVKGAKGCVMCHNSTTPKHKKFHFQKMWEKIKHK